MEEPVKYMVLETGEKGNTMNNEAALSGIVVWDPAERVGKERPVVAMIDTRGLG